MVHLEKKGWLWGGGGYLQMKIFWSVATLLQLTFIEIKLTITRRDVLGYTGTKIITLVVFNNIIKQLLQGFYQAEGKFVYPAIYCRS